jgi:hypothetical protein
VNPPKVSDVAGVNPPEHFRGTLLLADTRTALLLANEARHRAVQRVFGLSPEQDNVLTLLALGLMASAMHDAYRKVMEGPPFPTGADLALGGASASELMLGVAGPPSRKGPLLGALLLGALLAGGARPVLRRSLAGLVGEERKLSFDFHRRYGYLVDPGHWRQRRAERRQRGGALPSPGEGNA